MKKIHPRIPNGMLLAGAAAFILATAVAARADLDAPETPESDQADISPDNQGQALVSGRLSNHFAAFAGSEANATALVTGLRNGTDITLTASTADGQTTTTTFTPATGLMGYGNVYLSLNLAQQELAKLGITQPTPEQLRAALAGGSVTTGEGSTAVTTQLTGILVLRSQGQGWGEIAHTLGVNLRSAEHTEMAAAAHRGDKAARRERAGTSETGAPEPREPTPVPAQAVAAASTHPDTAASLHTGLSSSPHPDAPAMSHRPDTGAAGRPDTRPAGRPDMPAVGRPDFGGIGRPDIPTRSGPHGRR